LPKGLTWSHRVGLALSGVSAPNGAGFLHSAKRGNAHHGPLLALAKPLGAGLLVMAPRIGERGCRGYTGVSSTQSPREYSYDNFVTAVNRNNATNV
jgi:hypothetical protein